MSDFTYSIPFSNEKLLAGIIYQLKRDNLYDIANLLKGCNVEVEEGGYSHYSGGGRWDAHSAYVTFYVNPANIDFLDTPETKSQGLFHQIQKEVTFCGLPHEADA